MLTDASGTATLRWALPTQLAVAGGYHSVALHARLPNGSIAADRRDVQIVAAPAVRIEFYYEDHTWPSGPLRWTGTLWRQLWLFDDFYDAYVLVQAVDRFGNLAADVHAEAIRSTPGPAGVVTASEPVYRSCTTYYGYYSCWMQTSKLWGGRYDFTATADTIALSAQLLMTVCIKGKCSSLP